jgi:hypothetical protein
MLKKKNNLGLMNFNNLPLYGCFNIVNYYNSFITLRSIN